MYACTDYVSPGSACALTGKSHEEDGGARQGTTGSEPAKGAKPARRANAGTGPAAFCYSRELHELSSSACKRLLCMCVLTMFPLALRAWLQMRAMRKMGAPGGAQPALSVPRAPSPLVVLMLVRALRLFVTRVTCTS